MVRSHLISKFTFVTAACALLLAGGCRHKKYENPISKDTQQPDKVLFDKSVKDIERGRYEIARITLNTLINTYDASEFLAKAKLAIADSWYREGGSHGWAQAEAEYKDFILFYPTLEESAEAQERVCLIHFKQMEKADRDPQHASRAETECRQLLVQFPNSKYAVTAEQRLREIQEVLAESEMRVGTFYHSKGSNPAAANRFSYLVNQYPLYSGADDALWQQADSYNRMGPRFRQKAGDSYAKIVRDYPLSGYADNARKKLKELEMAVPEADPVAEARMKYEMENRTKAGLLHPVMTMITHGPDVHTAAKSGTPQMANAQPPIPESVPIPVSATGVGNTDVTAGPVTGANSVIDSKPDARQNPPTAAAAAVEPAPAQPLPTNQQGQQRKKKKVKTPPVETPATAPATTSTTLAAPTDVPATPPAPPNK